MQLFTPLLSDAGAPLARANPLAKISAALLLMAVLFASIDPLTPALVGLQLLVTVALSGIGARPLLTRAWPILGVALAIALVNVVLAPQRGGELVRIGPLVVGAESLVTGAALGMRLVGIALTGVLALASIEPIELADALIGQLRVSPRFALGALAAVRLLPVLAEERQTIALARRARGLEAGRSPVATARLAAGVTFGLLVSAVRRGTRLALAMEARGLGAKDCRTVARQMRMRAADWGWIAAAAIGGGSAVGISVALGSWRFVLG